MQEWDNELVESVKRKLFEDSEEDESQDQDTSPMSLEVALRSLQNITERNSPSEKSMKCMMEMSSSFATESTF